MFMVSRYTGWLHNATAQQAAVNRLVAGSNPARGANKIKRLAGNSYFAFWP